jgi:anthranilate synthase component 1
MQNLNVVSHETLADTDTPVSAYMKLCDGIADSFLLESVETKEITGRYSIIAYDPIFGLQLNREEGVQWNSEGKRSFEPNEFFALLKDELRDITLAPEPTAPSVGSMMGFVGYDAVRLIERLPSEKMSHVPVARLVFPSRFAIFDHISRKLTLIGIDQDTSICEKKINEMREELKKPLLLRSSSGPFNVEAPPRERYCASVEKAKEYIREGHIFQVVLADSFQGTANIEPFEVYRRLRVNSPSPYMFFLDLGEYRMLGASPETLVQVRDNHVTVMPIAGTRGRSSDMDRDVELERELLGSEKETAEHLMLVDLARNDVGRVSQYGSVSVDPYMTVQRYSHVMHLVSKVRGRLKEGSDIVDAFIAGFPAGTVSGAPKVRAMEIIDELESSARGPYAGAVGYFGPNGNMDTCIAIRTILFEREKFSIRVGAGIVADSIPDMEYKEIQNKAAQSLYALETAVGGD